VGGLEGWPGLASAQVYIYDPATNSFTQGVPCRPLLARRSEPLLEGAEI
jgi:hypothetical protein